MLSRQGAEQIEWIAGAFSALVVLGMIGFFVYEALFVTDRLPQLSVTLDPYQPDDGAHLRYKIANSGGRAASRVTLSLTLADGGKRSVIIDHVPAHSEISGGLYLPERSGAEDLELTVEGYVDP
jgi:uncharacterized protein (TIGR02588 family)